MSILVSNTFESVPFEVLQVSHIPLEFAGEQLSICASRRSGVASIRRRSTEFERNRHRGSRA